AVQSFGMPHDQGDRQRYVHHQSLHDRLPVVCGRGEDAPPDRRWQGYRSGGSLLRALVQIERNRIHAVAQPGRLRTVIEEVAQMAPAACAVNLGPTHEQASILLDLDATRFDRLIEAGPTSTRLEFRRRVEEW